MQDLTKIDKPFCLLDKETQERLKAHGGPYQLFINANRWDTMIGYDPSWHEINVYRVKPQPETEIIQTTVSPPKAPEKPEVKVGSWWKSTSNRIPFEVLSICGNTAFVRYENEQRGYLWYINGPELHTPYTPPRKCEAWVNVYADGNRYRFGITNYANEQNARDEGSADELYIATVKIEYVEGQDND